MILKSIFISGISASLAAYSVGLLIEGYASDRYSSRLTYPVVDAAAASRAYQGLPKDVAPEARALASRRLIAASPADPDSWTAVSYAEWRRAGAMSPRALEALDHAYAVSFFDPGAAVWRVGFALENWASLPPALRKDVLAEAGVALKDPVIGPQLKARLGEVRNAEGRLAAVLLLSGSCC